jgi:hypothetical protein
MVQTAALLASSLWGGACSRTPAASWVTSSMHCRFFRSIIHHALFSQRRRREEASSLPPFRAREVQAPSTATSVLGVRRTTDFFFLLGAAVVPTNLMARDQCMCFALVCSFCTRSDPREDDPDLTSDPRFHGREDHAWLCFSLFGIRRFDDC